MRGASRIAPDADRARRQCSGLWRNAKGVSRHASCAPRRRTGDRRDDDIRDLGRISAEMFDHIIIRQDKFLRGREAEDIVRLLVEGIQEVKPEQSYEYVPKEIEALRHAFSIARPGSFITALSDVIDNAIEVVQEYLDEEAAGVVRERVV